MSDLVAKDAMQLSLGASAMLASQGMPASGVGLLEGTAVLQGAVGAATDFMVANTAIVAGGAGVVGAAALGSYLVYRYFDDIKAAARRLAGAMKRMCSKPTTTPEERLHQLCLATKELQALHVRYKLACDRLHTDVQNYKHEQKEDMRKAVQRTRDRRKQARDALDKAEEKVDVLARRVASG